MGNIKNSKHHKNKHRHVFRPSYKRRSLPQKYQKPEKSPPSSTFNPEGSRIINLTKLQEYSQQLSTHSANCSGSVVVKGETRQGLASIISWQCQKCKQALVPESSTKVKGPRGKSQWECNLAAVWGKIGNWGRTQPIRGDNEHFRSPCNDQAKLHSHGK